MGITTAGLVELKNLAGDIGSPVAFDYIAVGTGTTAFSASQTTLVAEISDSGLSRIQVTPTSVTVTVANDTLQLTNDFSVTGSKTLGEVAVLNASSTGDMVMRVVLSPTRSVVNGDTYSPIFKMTFASA